MVGNSGEFKPKYAHLGDGVFTIYDYDRSNILGRGPADRSFRISAVLAIRHAADEEGTPTSPNTSVEFTVLVAADGVENLKRQRSVSPLTTVAAELERAAVQAPSLPQHPALHRQPTRLVLSEHDAADGDGGGGVDSHCNTDNHRVVTFKFRASNSHLKNTFVFLLIRNIKLYIYDPATRLQQPAGVGGGGRHGLGGGPSAAAGAAAGGSTGAADHHLASHDLGGVSRPSVVDRFIKGQHLDSSSDAESVASAGSGSDGGGGDSTPNALMSEMALGGGASRGNRGQAAAGGSGAHRPAFFPGPSTGIGASGASAFTAAGGGSRGLPIGTRSAEAAQRYTSTAPFSIVNKDYAISQSLRTGPAPQWASASYAAGAAGATGAGPAFPSAFGGGIGLGGLGLQRQGALGMPASSSSSSFSGVSSNGGGVRAFGSGIGIGALPRIMSVPTEGAEDAHSATDDADGSTTGREGGPAGEDAAAASAAAADDATASSPTSSSSSSDASDSDDADDDEGVFGALGSAGGAAQAKHHKTKQRRTVRATGRVAALQRSQSTDSVDSIDDTTAAMQRRMQRQQSPPLTAVAAAAIPPPAPAAAAPVVATAAAQPGAWKRRARLQPSSTYPETSPEHRSPPPVTAQPTRSPLQRSMTAASSSSGQLAQHHHNAGHQAQQLQLQQAPQLVPQTHIGEGEGGSQYGVWCAQGGRSRMEDAHIMCCNLLHYASTSAAAAEGAQPQQQQQQEQDGAAGVAARLDRTSYFAIFDGHGGTSAAEFAKENVVKAVVASLLQQQQQGSAVVATNGSAGADPTVITDGGHAAAGAGGSTQHGHAASSHPHPLPLPAEVRDIDVAFQHAFRVVDEALLRSADAEVASGTKDRDRRCKSGTTALAVVLRGSDVVVASLGDCRAVMARPMRHGAGAASAAALPLPVSPQQQQQLTALRQLGYESVEVLSIEHTPANEVLRIRAAGGWVTSEKEVSVAKLQHMDLSHPLVQRRLQAGMESIIEHQISRLCGELGVSRALGDAEYKGVARMATYEHWAWPASKGPDERRFTADLVLSAPDIVHARLPIGSSSGSSSGSSTSASVATGAADSDGAGSDHHHEQLLQQQPSSPGHASAAAAAASSSPPPPFLILACDGLWDVMSSEDAVEIAAGYMHSVRERGVQRAADGGDAQPQGREEESLPMGAARQLVHMALKLGTSDNVTAMVVMLPS